MFELNLTGIRIKFSIIWQEICDTGRGGLSGGDADEVVTQMIHPDDREEFLEFWSLDRMAACLQEEGRTISLKTVTRKIKNRRKLLLGYPDRSAAYPGESMTTRS